MTRSHPSILSSPHWRALQRHVRVEVYGRDGGHEHPRVRFEVLAPPAVMRELLRITTPCVACGKIIYSVRVRSENKDERNPASRPPPKGHYYLAVSCRLETSIGCSRSGAARDEYTAIKLALRPDLAAIAQSRAPRTRGGRPKKRRPKPMKKPAKTTTTKKLTARDKALAKVAAAKIDLRTACERAADVARDASAKRKAAKKATTAQANAEAVVYNREKKLNRGREAIAKLEEKIKVAKYAKLAREALRDVGKREEAEEMMRPQADEYDKDKHKYKHDGDDEDETEVEEVKEVDSGATAADDMGADDEESIANDDVE